MQNNLNDATNLDSNILFELKTIKDAVLKREKPFINIDEASQYLGISKNTIYGYTSNKIIPFYKLQGRRLYFKIEDLNNFILNQKNKIKSSSEIETEAINHIIRNGRK